MIRRKHKNSKTTSLDNNADRSIINDGKNYIVDWDLFHEINRTSEKTLESIRELFRKGEIWIPENRIYKEEESVVFRRLRQPFGGLSNRAKGYSLSISGTMIPTAEALYQSCRYTSDIEKQRQILSREAAFKTEDIAEYPGSFCPSCREDWFLIRKKAMYWCLKVKLIQNPATFGKLLVSTGNMNIVNHNPESDTFWGVVSVKSQPGFFEGETHLGILLMMLRDELVSTGANVMIAEQPDAQESHILRKIPETISGKCF